MRKSTFSTDMLPPDLKPEEKARQWGAFLSEASDSDIDCPNADGFRGSMERLLLGEVAVYRAAATSIRLTRTRRHITADGQDGTLLLIANGARGLGGSTAGRDVDLRRGDAAAFSQASPHVSHALAGGSALGVMLPRAALVARGIDPEAISARRIHRNTDALRHLRAYVTFLMSVDTAFDPAVAAAASRHLVDLSTLSISSARDGAADDQTTSTAHASRAVLVIDAIVRRCEEADLDPNKLATGLGLSARTIQFVLNRAGTSFSDELREARLALAERLLVDPAERDRSIAEIAHACGFSDVSTFYRAFRRRGGRTPAELRGRNGR